MKDSITSPSKGPEEQDYCLNYNEKHGILCNRLRGHEGNHVHSWENKE